MRMNRKRASSFLVSALLSGCGGGVAPSAPGSPAPSVTPTVGADGGTVDGAAARLVVPANALSAPVAVTIRATTAVPLDPYAAVGSAVEVGPAGTAFAAPALLVLRYAGARPPLGIDESDLRLHVLQAGNGVKSPAEG